MIYLDLFIGFLEVGLFSFGGAYAAIPLIRDVVMAHGWLDDEMLTYMIAISESTPGPIMVIMNKFLQNPFVKAALSGLKPCIIGIILVTGALMILKNCGLLFDGKTDILTIGLTCGIAFIYFGSRKIMKKAINPIMLICMSAVVGIVAYAL